MAGIGRGADDEAVAADDLLRRGVPDDQLVVAVAGEVLRVDVHLLTRAAACAAEGDFSQTPHLAHQCGTFGGREDVDLVPGLVRVAHFAGGCQLREQRLPVEGFYNGCHLFLFHRRGKNINFTATLPGDRVCFSKNTLFCVLLPSVRATIRSVAGRPRGSGRRRRCGSACPSARTSRRGATASRC